MKSKMAESNKAFVPKKRTQFCSSCKNHNRKISKTGHKCIHKGCSCLLCRLLKQAQLVMCHQQRFWRHQKIKLDNNAEEIQRKGPACAECQQINRHSKKKHKKCGGATCFCENCSRQQVCDKCRNHNEIVLKKNHNSKCPYKECKCIYCSLTFKRRMIMKHLQRVRRAGQVTANARQEEIKKAEQLYATNREDLHFIYRYSNNNSSTHEEDYDMDSNSSEEDEESLAKETGGAAKISPAPSTPMRPSSNSSMESLNSTQNKIKSGNYGSTSPANDTLYIPPETPSEALGPLPELLPMWEDNCKTEEEQPLNFQYEQNNLPQNQIRNPYYQENNPIEQTSSSTSPPQLLIMRQPEESNAYRILQENQRASYYYFYRNLYETGRLPAMSPRTPVAFQSHFPQQFLHRYTIED